MFRILKLLAAASVVVAAPAFAETLKNDDIIQLSTIGLGDEAIIAKIQTSPNTFTLTTDDMIGLKAKGVSGPVIAAMLQAQKGSAVSDLAGQSSDSPDPTVPHPSGIYVLKNWEAEPKMARLDPTTSNQTKSGGFLGYALTGGLASMSIKISLPNNAARIASPTARPSFYFYFDQANQSLSQGGQTGLFGIGPGASVTSPNEFSLVKFKVKKDVREAKVGSYNITGAKSGVMDKDRIPFSYDEVKPGVFKVYPSGDLEPGQYGFLYSMSAGGGGTGMYAGGVQSARIFDFGIAGDPKAKK